jgi:hypothetical protein
MATISTNQRDVKLGNTKAGNIVNTQNNFTDLFNNDDALNEELAAKEPLIGTKNTAFNKNFYTGSPLMDGTASPGTSDTVARGDHRHATDVSRLAAAPDGTNPLIVNNKISTTYLPDEILGQLNYKGTFNASSPASIGTPQKGYYYICATAGNKNPDGTTATSAYAVGDWAVYNGESWDKIDNTDAVTMVNGQIGSVKTYKGTYSSSGLYWYGDTVAYNNVLYLCVNADATGTAQTTPGTNNAIWMAYGITSTATTSENGLMSASDKSKLDGIAANATRVLVDTTPTSGSNNAVSSGGVYTALQDLKDTIDQEIADLGQTETSYIYFSGTDWNGTIYLEGIQFSTLTIKDSNGAAVVNANVSETTAYVPKVFKSVTGGSSSSATGEYYVEVDFSSFFNSAGNIVLLKDTTVSNFAGYYVLVQKKAAA